MHDLDTLDALNQQAVDRSINAARAAGKYVVQTLDRGHTIHETPERANQAALPGDSILPPHPSWFATQRDQSEDRTHEVVAYRVIDGRVTPVPVE